MHCPWRRRTRAWGYEVIRAIDEDDPLRLIQAFKRPAELAFVDIDAQVERDYGGYAWTVWMHQYFGDTALHIALKWKRHRAVKAILSLRPNWTILSEAGISAAELVLQVYEGKNIAALKDEQEREYENAAMYAEEDAMRRLLVAEHEVRERVRVRKLAELHTARTIGIQDDAAILLDCGRVLATEGVQHRRRAVMPRGVVATRWASHVCRELRRNRFSAQRGAMRRNVIPATAASVSPPSPTRQRQSHAEKSARMSPTNNLEAPSSRAQSRHTKDNKRRGRLNGGDAVGGDVDGCDARSYFDSAISARGSPPHVEVSSPSQRIEAGSVSSRPTSVGGPRSVWGKGKQNNASPRFDRSSRMAAMRKTHILATEKSAKHTTPRDRLQRKMATKQAPPKALVALESAIGSPPERLVVTVTADKAHGKDNMAQDGSKVEVPSSANGLCAVAVSKELGSSGAESDGRGSAVVVAERECQPLAALAGEDNQVACSETVNSSLHNNDRTTIHIDIPTRRHLSSGQGSTARMASSPSRKCFSSAGTTANDNIKNSGEELERGLELSLGNSAIDTDNKGITATKITAPTETTPQRHRLVPPMETLSEIPSGPVKDVLTALLTGTAIREDDGERVLTPIVARISSQHELKYSGPMVVGVPSQASAMSSVLATRPGVLIHLSLVGKRLGDPGASQLATALAGIRKVDLRHNNIGDPGTRAIAAALTGAASGKREAEQNGPHCLIESLSLAGNRVGDTGGQALFEMVTHGKHVPSRLRWLSVAGNPCMSVSARRRLASAGLHRPSNTITVVV